MKNYKSTSNYYAPTISAVKSALYTGLALLTLYGCNPKVDANAPGSSEPQITVNSNQSGNNNTINIATGKSNANANSGSGSIKETNAKSIDTLVVQYKGVSKQ